MTTPATNSIVSKKEPYFTVQANGTTYRITIILFNNKGEARALNQNSFQNIPMVFINLIKQNSSSSFIIKNIIYHNNMI